jgi:ketosteroid isomerase-like protein
MRNDIDTLVDGWKEAERAGDRARLESLLTDDFVGIGPVGFVLARDAWLARFKSGLPYVELDLDEISTRRYGDSAVVVAHQHAAGEAQGDLVTADTRVSLVVVGANRSQPHIAGIQYSFMPPRFGTAQGTSQVDRSPSSAHGR